MNIRRGRWGRHERRSRRRGAYRSVSHRRVLPCVGLRCPRLLHSTSLSRRTSTFPRSAPPVLLHRLLLHDPHDSLLSFLPHPASPPLIRNLQSLIIVPIERRPRRSTRTASNLRPLYARCHDRAFELSRERHVDCSEPPNDTLTEPLVSFAHSISSHPSCDPDDRLTR